MTRDQYAAYRQTPRWQGLVMRLQARAGMRCEGEIPAGDAMDPFFTRRCTETTQLHAHHRTYERLGHEVLDDLVLLCVRCHVVVHLLGAECHCCGESILDEDEAWEIVDGLAAEDLASPDAFQAAFDEASYHWHWPYCSYCEHVLSKDD